MSPEPCACGLCCVNRNRTSAKTARSMENRLGWSKLRGAPHAPLLCLVRSGHCVAYGSHECVWPGTSSSGTSSTPYSTACSYTAPISSAVYELPPPRRKTSSPQRWNGPLFDCVQAKWNLLKQSVGTPLAASLVGCAVWQGVVWMNHIRSEKTS